MRDWWVDGSGSPAFPFISFPAVLAQAEVQTLSLSTWEWVDEPGSSSTSLITTHLCEGAIVSCLSSLR